MERLELRKMLAAAPSWAFISAPAGAAAAGYVTTFATAPTAAPVSIAPIAGVRSTMAGAAGFQIEVVFPDSTLTAAQQQVFTDAAARWSQVIIGDLPDVTAGGQTIDDVQITATAPFIDGAGGTLGQAGPTAVRSGSRGLPYRGQMQFDSADVATMVSQNTFRDVVLHEMGHVLGIGTLWNSGRTLSTGAGTPLTAYTGPLGTTAYRLLGRTGNLPLETGGGEGTADAHWSESRFGTELMTGYINATNQLSAMTIASLADLGYQVDLGQADAYTPPVSPFAALISATDPRTEALLGDADRG
jgi:hypothetical protein